MLRTVAGSCLIACVLVALAATAARAQPPGQAPANATEPPVEVDPLDQTVDVRDLLRLLRPKEGSAPAAKTAWDYRKPMLVVAPTIGSKPSTGFTVGVAANLAVYFGDPATTRISSGMLGLSVSTKAQTSMTARFGVFTRDDRVRVEGDNRFQWTSQDIYALGTTSDTSGGVNARFTYTRVYETAFHKLRNRLFAGVGLHLSAHTNIRPGEGAEAAWDSSPYSEYTQLHGFDPDSQTSAGASLNLLVDTRDNPINASKGWLASVSYRPFFEDVLGSDSAWQEVLVDVRTFAGLRKDGRQTLAFWLYGDFVAHGIAPYFDLPTLGMDTYGRSGRGYSEGRFRGERLLYGEVEYRATLTRNGLLGMVAFANTTTISDLENKQRLFDSFAPAGGIGLRLLFNKRSRTNLCVDVAWGEQGSKGLYLALQEAF